MQYSFDTLASVFNALTEGVFFVDADGALTAANPAFCEMLGYDEADVSRLKFIDLAAETSRVAPDIMAGISNINLRLYYFHRAEKKTLPMHMIHKDGTLVSVRLRSVLFRDRDGAIARAAGIIEREASADPEAAGDAENSEMMRIWEMEQDYQSVLANSGDAIVITDFNGWIATVNKAAADLLGHDSPGDLTGRYLLEFAPMVEGTFPCTTGETVRIDREFQDRQVAVSNQLFETGRLKCEQYFVRKDGMLVPVEATLTLLKDTKGDFRGTIAICRDITDRRQAEKQLIKARDELEEKVKQRTVNLEESNTALRFLLNQRDRDRKDFEEKVLASVNELVMPYVEKLKDAVRDDRQRAYLEILESNLSDIVSPFSAHITERNLLLSPAETQIANLIKRGKTTKEIAELVNLSGKTVETHRESIRKKLGIKNKKISLRSYLKQTA